MKQWVRLRKELYKQVQRHIHHLVGSESKGLALYRQKYEREFSRRWMRSSREELIAQVARARLIYLADFHALMQSQKAQARILKSLAPRKSRVLAVEFFEACDQPLLDQLCSGELAKKDFLQMIDWERKWGFPWSHYEPVVDWALENQVPIRALNLWQPKRTAETLAKRDHFAARIISQLINKNPDGQVIVIFGDLHLASSHLIKQVQNLLRPQKVETVTVFQNSEKLYFRLLQRELEFHLDVVKLSSGKYCLMSVPPWVKWQSYLLYLESRYDENLKEDGIDFTEEVERYLKILAQDLKVPSRSGEVSIYTASDDLLLEKLKSHFSESDFRWLQLCIEESANFYCPELQLGFLARPTVNHAAALAMSVLHAQLSNRKKTFTRMPEDFHRWIWVEAVDYFGSKMINPKRKTDTIHDLRASLAAKSPRDKGREALKLALSQRLQEVLFLSGARKSQPIGKTRRKSSYREAAHMLGGMLGEKLFHAFRQKKLSLNKMKSLLETSLESDEFSFFYYQMLRLVEQLPEPFISKTEKM